MLDKRKSNSLLSTFLQDIDLEQLKTLVSNMKAKPLDCHNNKLEFLMFPTFLCLPTTNITSKPLLPISVDTNLPHFLLDIGQTNADTSFKLSIAYDTCAVLCVGWSGLHLTFAHASPHLVKSLVWAKDKFNPITLSGIVSSKDDEPSKVDKLCTVLPAVIKYYTPHTSKQGHPTSFKVAMGDNIAINTLLGMSMICPAKFSLDLEDDVINSSILDTVPFPVTYKQTNRSLPNLASLTDSSAHASATECVTRCLLYMLCLSYRYQFNTVISGTHKSNPYLFVDFRAILPHHQSKAEMES
jgi:hypothetical protein